MARSARCDLFGAMTDGHPVELYTLTNRAGMQVSLMTYGAAVVNLRVPDRHGKLDDVALGFDRFEPYLTDSHYFGCTVGRFANRIARGRFELDGKTFTLACNDGPNALHGGVRGFDKQVWRAQPTDESSVLFTRRSVDGEEGYAGNLDVLVNFTLTESNELVIHYQAATDAPTVLNLTNHTYFNLAGQGSVLDHQLELHADRFTPVDATLIPTGEVRDVANSPMDFRQATPIGARLSRVGGNPPGYDHNYVLRHRGNVAIAAALFEPRSGRLLEVYTDQPGIQFYSGNFLDGTVMGKGGQVYDRHTAVCLETQHFPDSPNHPNFPSTVLRPGQTYKTTTVYKFSTRQ